MRFSLDQRLAADTVPVGDLALCRLLLMNDATHPWLILVPRRPDLAELIDLSAPERVILIEEIAAVSEALRAVASPTKLNVAALGNVVRQLHVHVIARFETDPAWPGPVWGRSAAVPYHPAAAKRFVRVIADVLGPALATPGEA